VLDQVREPCSGRPPRRPQALTLTG
jgi:hypothetical protein